MNFPTEARETLYSYNSALDSLPFQLPPRTLSGVHHHHHRHHHHCNHSVLFRRIRPCYPSPPRQEPRSFIAFFKAVESTRHQELIRPGATYRSNPSQLRPIARNRAEFNSRHVLGKALAQKLRVHESVGCCSIAATCHHGERAVCLLGLSTGCPQPLRCRACKFKCPNLCRDTYPRCYASLVSYQRGGLIRRDDGGEDDGIMSYCPAVPVLR